MSVLGSWNSDAEPHDRTTHDWGELCEHGAPVDTCESASCCERQTVHPDPKGATHA